MIFFEIEFKIVYLRFFQFLCKIDDLCANNLCSSSLLIKLLHKSINVTLLWGNKVLVKNRTKKARQKPDSLFNIIVYLLSFCTEMRDYLCIILVFIILFGYEIISVTSHAFITWVFISHAAITIVASFTGFNLKSFY